MDETINTAQIDEYTISGDVLNSTFEYLAFLQLADDFLLLLFEFCLDESLVAYNNIAVFLVDLNNLEFHCLSNEYVVVADGLNINLATRKECFDTKYINNHTTLSAALDVALDDFFVFKSSVNAIPSFAQTSFLMRKHQLATLVFLIFDVNFNRVTYFQVGVVTEFAHGNDTVTLEADANNDFALVNRDDLTFNNIVVVYLTEGLRVGLLVLFFALACCYST